MAQAFQSDAPQGEAEKHRERYDQPWEIRFKDNIPCGKANQPDPSGNAQSIYDRVRH
jgi:hypothetical protein